MNALQTILDAIRTLLTWWFIVEPWEQAIRVRLGKRVRLFGAGTHFRIPYFDGLYIQNIRRRVSEVPIQTLTSSDGKMLTLHGSLGYRIADVLLLHQSLHDAEWTVRQEVLGRVADFVIAHPIVDCCPASIAEHVRRTIRLERYGFADVEFFLTGFVSNVRTIRLISDSMSVTTYYGLNISTQGRSADVPAANGASPR